MAIESDDAFRKRIFSALDAHDPGLAAGGPPMHQMLRYKAAVAIGWSLDDLGESLGLLRSGTESLPKRLAVRDSAGKQVGWLNRSYGFPDHGEAVLVSIIAPPGSPDSTSADGGTISFLCLVVEYFHLPDGMLQKCLRYVPGIEKAKGWEPFVEEPTAKDIVLSTDVKSISKYITADDSVTIDTGIFLMPVRASIVRGIVVAVSLAEHIGSPLHVSVVGDGFFFVEPKK